MRREGWIVQDPATEKYRLGPVPVEIGLAALATLEFRAVARPHLEAMAERTGETSYLGILLGSDVVYVDVVLGGHAIVAKRDIGARLPAYRTAIGKVLLANLSRDQLKAILLATAPNSSPERLEGELAEIRRLSIALNDEESAPGVFSLASPLRDFNGHVVAGIGIGGPKTRLLPQLKEYSDLVKQAALAASQSMGYHSSITGS
jgi:DNA-binding IclR family transcriptional regulator